MTLLDRIAAVEAGALAVYEGAGLPVRPGHYRKGPRARKWTFLDESLSPGQRWEIALERPVGSGFRFRTLAFLGQDHRDPLVMAASRRLIVCADLRTRLTAGTVGDAEADALIASLEG